MIVFILSLVFLVVALTGYYLSVKPSRLEKEIRKKKLDYQCFECKEIISINDVKCPKCSLQQYMEKDVLSIGPFYLY